MDALETSKNHNRILDGFAQHNGQAFATFFHFCHFCRCRQSDISAINIHLVPETGNYFLVNWRVFLDGNILEMRKWCPKQTILVGFYKIKS